MTDKDMKQLKVLKDMLEPEVLSKLQELHSFLNGQGHGANFVDSFEYFLKKKGPDCMRLPYLKAFFEKDYGKNVASIINELYHSWSKQYE